MNLLEFINKYYLHDSIIEEITYIFNQSKLEIQIELCNWKQVWYKDNDPEIIKGKVEFIEVNSYSIEPSDLSSGSAEILEVQVEECDSNIEVIKFILLDDEEVKVVKIGAKDVIWIH